MGLNPSLMTHGEVSIREAPQGIAADDVLKLCAFIDWIAEQGYVLASPTYPAHRLGKRPVFRPISAEQAVKLAEAFRAACKPPTAAPIDQLDIGRALVEIDLNNGTLAEGGFVNLHWSKSI